MSTSFKPNRELIDSRIRAEMKKELGHERITELVPLDHRYSNNEKPAWSGYERYVDLKSGRTIYVGLTKPSDPSVSVREKADKFAMAKGEKKLARLEARAAKKAAKAEKPKASEPKAKPVKTAPKVKAAKPVKTVAKKQVVDPLSKATEVAGA